MELGERQQRTIAVALTILASAVILLAVIGLFWLFAGFLRTFSHVFLPLAVAGVGALVFRPNYDWLRTRARLPVPAALAALFASVMLPVALFATFFGVILVGELGELVGQVPVWWEHLSRKLDERAPEIQRFLAENPFGKKVAEALQRIGPLLGDLAGSLLVTAQEAGRSVGNILGGLLSWVVAPVYFSFFLIAERRGRARIEDYLPFLKPDTREDVAFLAREFVKIVVAFFRGQLLIAFFQGLLFAIGLKIVGLQYGFALGMLLGFLNVIPYLGSILGLAITLPLAYFQTGGGFGTLGAVIAVLCIVQLVEGYLLTPKIMGDRTGLHPMVIIVAIFFWGTALHGILGMILAIPLTAFLVVFWRLIREKYVREIV